MKFGKLAPKSDYRTLRLGTYLTPQLPAPPPEFHVVPRVEKATNLNNVKQLFPMDGNDRYGDCTIAAAAHAVTVYAGMVGKKAIPLAKSVIDTYFHLSGGQDTGLYELDVLNYWRQTGIGGEKINAFAKIDHRNHDRVKSAVSIFGAVYIGFQVQENAISDFNHRRVWTPGRLTNSGHAVLVTGYTAKQVTVLTWGDVQGGTWDWWDECVDEAYAIIPTEGADPKFSPGLDLAALKADLEAVTA